MRFKNLMTFTLAVVLSLMAAHHRWGDSSHAIGLINADGGRARHPSFFSSGKDRYAQITTATVLPPYEGDVRVALEGVPELDYDIYFSEPVIDLGLRNLPEFKDHTIYGLKPTDRPALWVLMRPPPIDPVCEMKCEAGFMTSSYQGKEYCFCAEACRTEFLRNPKAYVTREYPKGTYSLAFYDKLSGRSVLKIPFVFKGKEKGKNAGVHQH